MFNIYLFEYRGYIDIYSNNIVGRILNSSQNELSLEGISSQEFNEYLVSVLC